MATSIRDGTLEALHDAKHAQVLWRCWGCSNDLGDAKFGIHALRYAATSLFIEQGWNPKQILTLVELLVLADREVDFRLADRKV